MDGDEPVGDWATSHDSVHDVLVNKKSNAMLVFILFSTEDDALVAHLTPPSGCIAEGAVLVDPGGDRFGTVWLCSVIAW